MRLLCGLGCQLALVSWRGCRKLRIACGDGVAGSARMSQLAHYVRSPRNVAPNVREGPPPGPVFRIEGAAFWPCRTYGATCAGRAAAGGRPARKSQVAPGVPPREDGRHVRRKLRFPCNGRAAARHRARNLRWACDGREDARNVRRNLRFPCDGGRSRRPSPCERLRSRTKCPVRRSSRYLRAMWNRSRI